MTEGEKLLADWCDKKQKELESAETVEVVKVSKPKTYKPNFVALSCYGMKDWVPFFSRCYTHLKGRKLKRIKNKHKKVLALVNKHGSKQIRLIGIVD